MKTIAPIKQQSKYGDIRFQDSEDGISLIQKTDKIDWVIIEKENTREVALAICPELEQEKIDFAVGFKYWCDNGNEAKVIQSNGGLIASPQQLIDLYKKQTHE